MEQKPPEQLTLLPPCLDDAPATTKSDPEDVDSYDERLDAYGRVTYLP